jgi:release factor glutamine methyltransferase
MPSNAVLTAGLTIAQARRSLADAFRQGDLDTPELDARLLTGYVLGLDYTALLSQSERKLDNNQTTKLHKLALRRLDREPVARILGVKEFWGLSLRLNASTLVPRPETETVVEEALAAVDRGGPRSRALRIADLGTGSGALLLALLTELPNAFGIGTDLDRDALVMARGNAARHGLAGRTRFAACDFGAALRGGFALVVSNPPYVTSVEMAALPPEVRHDPPLSLDGGADGLASYRTIARQTRALLAPGGALVVELGYGQEPAVAELFKQCGLQPSRARTDLAGVPRAFRARVATMTP